MSLIREAGRLIGVALERVVFGPETTGVVQAVKRDVNNPLTYHVLVRTGDGELKHFTQSESQSPDNIVIGRGGARFNSMTERVGQRWQVRTRGAGVFLLPGSVTERDPFNLKV